MKIIKSCDFVECNQQSHVTSHLPHINRPSDNHSPSVQPPIQSCTLFLPPLKQIFSPYSRMAAPTLRSTMLQVLAGLPYPEYVLNTFLTFPTLLVVIHRSSLLLISTMPNVLLPLERLTQPLMLSNTLPKSPVPLCLLRV